MSERSACFSSCFSGAFLRLRQAQGAKIVQRAPSLRGEMIVADQADVFPSQRGNVSHGCFRDVFSALAQGRDGDVEVDGIPGGNGRHDQMETTGAMDLILQGTIAQLPQAAKEELAGERMQRFPFVEADQDAPAQCRVAEVLQKERGPFQLAQLGEGPGDLILARVGCQLAHQQGS